MGSMPIRRPAPKPRSSLHDTGEGNVRLYAQTGHKAPPMMNCQYLGRPRAGFAYPDPICSQAVRQALAKTSLVFPLGFLPRARPYNRRFESDGPSSSALPEQEQSRRITALHARTPKSLCRTFYTPKLRGPLLLISSILDRFF